MEATATSQPRLDFGRIWSLTGRIVRHFALPLMVLGGVLFAIPNALFGMAMSTVLGPLIALGERDPESAMFMARAIGVGRMAFPLFTLYLLQAGVLRHVFATREGRTASIGDSLSFALRRSGVAFVLAVIVFICVLAGTVLLIVPGVLVWTSWFVVMPIAVLEGAGSNKALNRSGALVRGNRGPIFAVSLLVLAALFGVEMLIRLGAVMWLAPTFDIPLPVVVGPMALASLAADTVIAVYFVAAASAIYIQLKGLDADSAATADVFG